MSLQFSDLFQYTIKSDSYVRMTLEDLLEASAHASTAQYPLNQKKVDSIVKSVLKGGSLLVAPMNASLLGVGHLVSGRHRIEAARTIINSYGINAKGKAELKTEVNAASLTPIGHEILVDTVEVDSPVTLAALILAMNESRTMSAPEKASVKNEGGYATPGDRFKLRFMPFLEQNLNLADTEGKPIVVTPITLAQIAGKFATAIKNLSAATDEQLNTIAGHLNEYLCDECDLPTKFAQYYSEHVADFLGHAVELTDENDEVIENYDKDGHPVVLTYAQYMTNQLPVVEKKAKAVKKSAVDAEKFAAMERKLAEMGITV
jgi:hypothetical protein